MTQADLLITRATALQQQLSDVHGLKGRNLAQALARGRRVVPKALRQGGLQIAQGVAMVGHPKLERMIDFDALAKHAEALSAHLDSVDVADIRRGRLLALAGRIAFYVIVVATCFMIWAVRSGHL